VCFSISSFVSFLSFILNSFNGGSLFADIFQLTRLKTYSVRSKYSTAKSPTVDYLFQNGRKPYAAQRPPTLMSSSNTTIDAKRSVGKQKEIKVYCRRGETRTIETDWKSKRVVGPIVAILIRCVSTGTPLTSETIVFTVARTTLILLLVDSMCVCACAYWTPVVPRCEASTVVSRSSISPTVVDHGYLRLASKQYGYDFYRMKYEL